MKLHLLQRWAYKLGVPLKVLNVFAQEYYGYAIPNADGKYPDWWYEEQGVPNSFRDCEVPKEVLEREHKGRDRGSASPKVYVRVKHGRVVEVVANSTLQSEPDLSRYRRSQAAEHPQTLYTRERYEVHRGNAGIENGHTDEIVTRFVETTRNDIHEPDLTRSTSVPVFPAGTREDDIMSFIREDAMPRSRRPTTVPGMVDPGALLHNTTSAYPGFTHPQRSATAPTPHPNPAVYHHPVPSPRIPSGSGLPNSPRPVRHQRTHTNATDDSVLRYYYSSTANAQAPTSVPHRQQRGRQFTPMQGVQEDEMTEWSGYAEDDYQEWEEEGDDKRRADMRQAAAEKLREYRREH
jgi:hypothetical protein